MLETSLEGATEDCPLEDRNCLVSLNGAADANCLGSSNGAADAFKRSSRELSCLC